MAKKMVLTEDQAMELFTFFIVCARTQLDDPHHYASMRFLTAAEKVRDFISSHVSSETKKLLDESVDKTENAQIIMNDTQAFATVLDELCTMVAQYQVEQTGLTEKAS
jgi:hypothetical protein